VSSSTILCTLCLGGLAFLAGLPPILPNVFQGGPVALDSALGLVQCRGDQKEPMGWAAVRRDRTGGLDAPPLVVMPRCRASDPFAGYARLVRVVSWNRRSATEWYVVEFEARDAFTSERRRWWFTVLRRQRSNLAFAASLPDDPTMN